MKNKIAGWLAVFALLGPGAALAEYPDKPVKIIVPQAQGGGYDLAGRIVGQKLSELTGQQYIVENKPGGGTLLGTQTVAKSAPDGYTLLIGGLSNIAFNVGLYKSLPYDPKTELVPIALVSSVSFTMVAANSFPPNTFRQVVDYAKMNPGKVNYASAGNGTGQHITGAVVAHLTKMPMVHVPYRGAQAVYPDLMNNIVQLFYDNTATAKPQIESGNVKAIATSSRDPWPTMPQIPTFNESGLPGFELETWFGLFAPAGIPKPVMDRLRTEMAKVIAARDVRERFERAGNRMMAVPIPETEAFVRADIDKWSKLVKETGIELE
jgi:tripartite-type tricarboxylate transporter receptor subunit TctC